MGTVRLQATVQEFDIPYLERFLKGRYFIYFEVKNNGQEDFIEIQYFRSSKQQPLF